MLPQLLQYVPALTSFAQGASCTLSQTVFGIPTWYKYLPGELDTAGRCQVATNFSIFQLNSLLGIGIAVIEILLRLAMLIAVSYIIYAGFQYLTSNGDPERAKHGKDTILNALIGLVIAIVATVLVGFLGRSLS